MAVKRTLAELAKSVGGRLEGDPSREVCGVASLREAGAEDVAFVAGLKYRAAALASKAGCLVVPESWDGGSEGRTLIRVADPNRAMIRVAEALLPAMPVPPTGVHPRAVVAASAVLGRQVHVGACAVVGEGVKIGDRSRIRAGAVVADGAVVGEDCDIHAGVVIREGVRVGRRVVIHAGSVIGADGFGYVAGAAGPEKIPQLGTVEIGDDVELGACVTVDRARFGATRIGAKVKVDNLVQIAHNVEIGAGSILVSQVAVAGSTRIGCGCVVGGQAAIDGHLVIGDGARIAAKAGVTKDVPAGMEVSGYPAGPHREQLRAQAAQAKMTEVLERLRAMEKRLEALETEDKA